MNRNILEEFYSDPATYQRVVEQAHRERSAAIRAGFAWLRQQLTPRLNFHPNHWMERLG